MGFEELPPMRKGTLILCPRCDRPAIEVVQEQLPCTPIKVSAFKALPPTRFCVGAPMISGCCEAELAARTRTGVRFLAMLSREGAEIWKKERP